MSVMLRRILLSTFATLVLATPACAGTIIVKLTFVPGKLSAAAVPASATTVGPIQVPVTIADGRGSGSGWSLRLLASRKVTVTRITARCAASSTCKLPAETTTPVGNIILRASRDSGMGVMTLLVTVAPLPPGSSPTPLTFTVS
jgi:hypothetical protein